MRREGEGELMNMILNKPHGELPAGTVCRGSYPIGRISCRMRGTGPKGRARYWTAELPIAGYGSLGTRFESKREAADALHSFDASYPAVAHAATDPFLSHGYRARIGTQVEEWRKGRKQRYGF